MASLLSGNKKLCDTMEIPIEGEQIAHQKTTESSMPSNFQLLLNDPLLLQDLVLKEKERELDQDINLGNPLEEPCQLVEWNRLRRLFLSGRIDIRVNFSEEPIVIVMRLVDQLDEFNFIGIREIADWEGVPSFVKDLIEPQDSLEGFAGYVILSYDANHGWILLGCLASHPPAVGTDDSTVPLDLESEPVQVFEQSIEPKCDLRTVSSPIEECSVEDTKKKKRFRAFKICSTCKKEVLNRSFKSHLAMHDTTKWVRCLHCDFTSHRIDRIIMHSAKEHPNAIWVPKIPMDHHSPNSASQSQEVTTIAPSTNKPEVLSQNSPSVENEESLEPTQPLITSTFQTTISSAKILSQVAGTDAPMFQENSASAKAKKSKTKSKKGLKKKGTKKFDNLYECDICREKFHLKFTYKRHMRIHDPLKNKKCDQCVFTTSQEEELQLHILQFHPDVDQELPDDVSIPSTAHFSSSDEDSTTDVSFQETSSSDSHSAISSDETKKKSVRRRETNIILSNDWLFCPYCDYKSRRPDFLKIHVNRFHAEGTKEDSLPPSTEETYSTLSTSRMTKRRRRFSSSSSTSSNVNVVSSSDEIDASSTSESPLKKCKLRSQMQFQHSSTSDYSVESSKNNGISASVECLICKEGVNVANYYKHAAEHNLIKLKRCLHCDFTSPRQDLVDSHVARMHPKENRLKSVEPESKDSTSNNSQEHDQSQTPTNQIQSLVCRVAPQIGLPRPTTACTPEDPQPSTSMSHSIEEPTTKSASKASRPEICPICNMYLTDLGNYGNTFANHMELHSKVPDLGSFWDLVLPCEKCHYVSITHDSLIRHVGKHH